MRNALVVEGLIVTSDNSAAIGEKELDAVQVPDALAAKFGARVALAEQWAAGGEVSAIILHNFSGQQQWHRYIEGISPPMKMRTRPDFHPRFKRTSFSI